MSSIGTEMSHTSRLQLFAMKTLLLESELKELEERGLAIGHLKTLQASEVVDTELFEADILRRGVKMADFYVLYYCIENTIRTLISERLREHYGPKWWDEKVPEEVTKEVKKRQEAERDTAMSIRSDDPLTYSTFGELIPIFDSNWADFSDTIRSQKAMRDTLSQLNKLRGVIAHSCDLNDDEITRFKLLIRDWLRIQT